MTLHSVWFTGPRQAEVRSAPLPQPGPGQVRVRAECSAISPGTELLIYRGQAPADMAADESLASLTGSLAFPLKYGYSMVGRVEVLGAGVAPEWQDRRVFAFQPHETHFLAAPADLLPLPPELAAADAVCLPNMETAVNFLLDGAPRVGERVAVFGQGIVGLLTTALLGRLPLESLITLDRYPRRRELSLAEGATLSLGPDALAEAHAALGPDGADLTYELSGAPAALDAALQVTGFAGRVVIGSWYGTRAASLDLGGRFHRARQRLISSQVSTLTPELLARWTKARRLQTALRLLAQVRPSRFITHRLPLDAAPEAYALLDQRPEDAVLVTLEYASL